MWSLAQRMAISTQNSSEYPKTQVNIHPKTSRGGQTSRQSLVGYAHSRLPLGLAAPLGFGWIFTLVFREYFAIRFAKLHILPQCRPD